MTYLYIFSETFTNVLQAATVIVFKRIFEALTTSHKSTGVPPHFRVTVDKATPARNTVQCILLIAVYNGQKTVYPVGAPQVYRSTNISEASDLSTSDEDFDEPEEGDTSYIEGGLSQNLVEDIESRLTEKLNLTKDNLRFLTGESSYICFHKRMLFFSVYFKLKFG